MRLTPNFSNWQVEILHRADTTTDRLIRQLQLLGFIVNASWKPLAPDRLPDLVLVDADQGWNGLLPWTSVDAAPCPIVALLGSEAPSRISWAYDAGAGSILSKPVNTSAIYPALVMAVAVYEERQKMREHVAHLQERVRLRPLVLSAIRALSAQRRISEDEAYALLRTCAMRQRQPVEVLAAAFLAGSNDISEVG